MQFSIGSEQNFVDSVGGTWYCTVRRFVLDHFLFEESRVNLSIRSFSMCLKKYLCQNLSVGTIAILERQLLENDLIQYLMLKVNENTDVINYWMNCH